MKRHTFDMLTKATTIVAAYSVIAILLLILVYIVFNGIGSIDWHWLVGGVAANDKGILPMIVATVYMIALATIIATPLGVGTAIYMNEYANDGRLVNIVRFAIDSLAGIPSIIYGLFGYIFFAIALGFKMSILSGSATVAIMILPLIIRTTEEALKAVPASYREGSLALGANKITTIVKIILPCSSPGILTAIILAIGRIVGETAAVYLTAGMVMRMPTSIFDSGRTLAVHLYILAKEGISLTQAFATATILLLVVAIINFMAQKVTNRFLQKYR